MSESDNRDDDTPVLALMKALGIPLTREKYLDMAYMGQPSAGTVS